MSTLRFKVLDEAFKRKAVVLDAEEKRPSEFFGEHVFGRAAMAKYLSKRTYNAIIDAIDNGTPLSREYADGVATGRNSGPWNRVLPTIPTGSNLLPEARPKNTMLY